MADDQNAKRAKLLGMPMGTAANKLRKALLYKFAKDLGLDECFQCGLAIASLEDFSIEHKKPWQGAANPLESFMDLENIAFSHLSCNSRAGEKPNGFKAGNTPTSKVDPGPGNAWCSKCGVRPRSEFTSNKYRWSQVADLCKDCRSKYRSK